MQLRPPPLVLASTFLCGGCFQPGSPTNVADGTMGSSSSDSSNTDTTPDPSGSATTTVGHDSADSSSGAPAYDDPTSSSTTIGDSTGDDTTEGVVPCDPVGPADLRGVNPTAIWIANANQSTLSKIDTGSMVELGRYLTREDANGSPSRTAVSLSGDVVVANRNSGLTKFHGDASACTDINLDGAITTSTGSNFLPWADEECRAWHVPFAYTSHRPVAWTAGDPDEVSCGRINEKVWTAGVLVGVTIEVALVDGETGIVEQTVQIPEIAPDVGTPGTPFGFYGGAVDPEGNFWVSMLGVGYLARIDRQTLAYDYWPMPIYGYGMTYGASGYVFTCSTGVGRFDPVTETWVTAPNVPGDGGCAEDGDGRLWLANDPVVAIDVNTLAVVDQIDLPEYVQGVAIDFDGMLWGVGHGASTNAYRIDPNTGTFGLFGHLVGPDTYSDMTGFALANIMPH